MRFRVFSFLWFVCFGIGLLNAQLNAVIVGDAIDQGNNCYTITQDLEFQAGGVWYDNPIDFDEDFTIYYQNNFGSRDGDGADGMALVFKGNPTAELGGAGGGIGFAGLSPTLVVEFDTFQNGDNGDPVFDHMAILRDGSPNHNNPAFNLAGPIQVSSTNPNIEDGVPHNIKIVWLANTQIFEVYFDCQLRISLNFDIEANIFNGDETVYFGFVGSTGGFTNIHEVCFNSISFVENLQLQDESICLGDSIEIDASIPSGDTYSWSPVDGVSDPNIPNPTLSPTTTTTYSVTISDVCGESTTEEFTLSVFPIVDPVFDAVPAICAGDSLAPLPLVSNNGVTGTWTPGLNNSATTTYTFTPDDPCANPTTLEIIVNPLVIPTFSVIDPICDGDTLAELPTTSNNGVTGSWSPALDNSITTTYTFTPNAGQLCAQETTLEIIVNPLVAPLFDEVPDICQGDFLNELPTTSNNGISGSWSPELNNFVTTTYTFTPEPDECAITTTLDIIVSPNVTPQFDDIDPICEGDSLSDLPLISNNGITGEWSPELNNSETTTYTFTPSIGECAIEVNLTIEVIPNIVPVFDSFGPICPGQFIEELPTTSNNGLTGVWTPELNNFETTVYTFTPDQGQGCVVSTTTEIIVTEPIVPVFDEVDFICVGDPLNNLPIVSLDGILGFWSPALNNTETTTYTFTPDEGQCAIETTLTIEVIPISELSLDVEVISAPFSDNQTVVATVTGGTGSYQYQLDDGPWVDQNVFNNVSGCEEHVIIAREVSGCSNVASEIFRILEFPKFFTPNGDVFNPFWNIKCLDDQPGAKISIFDRYGKLLKVISTQGSGWDGTFTGSQMPADDYWFKVEYVADDGSPKTFTSHFTLKR